MRKKFAGILFLIGALTMGSAASAQTTPAWDTSGNGLLSGQYYMRHVLWVVEDPYGDLSEGTAVYGVITFDGNGNYSFSGQVFDNSNGSTAPSAYSQTGTYNISASGYGFMDSVVTNDEVYGLVSNGIFIGSSTENAQYYNDLFIAARIGSPQATNATLNGKYQIADLEYPAPLVPAQSEGYSVYARDSLTTFTADGNGHLTGVTSSGYIGANGGGATTQNIGSVNYAFSNGAANLAFTGSYSNSNIGSTLMVGQRFLYISADGNFVFGGSPVGYDMFVGVRAGTSGTASNFTGLYYQAGIDGFLNGQGLDPDSYFGSFYANFGSQAQGLGHQRYLEWINDGAPIDLTYADSYKFNSDGSSDDTGVNFSSGQHYIFGNSGAIRIGIGQAATQGYLGISVALQAPPQTGSGVYINPTAILNSASSALFTASIVPGELITIGGTGLVNGNGAVTTNFATSLDNVQVLMNGTPAPIYYAYPTLIAAIVPYEINPGDIVDIQVINNGVASNTVSSFAQSTQPGVFTNPTGGLGYAIAQHASDFSLITPSSPAQIGEPIVTYLTGLGQVNPTVTDGSPGGSNPTNNATNSIVAVVDGVQATVGYAGLVPTLIGLYQMNITVPSGIGTGNESLDITGPDSYSTEAILPVGTGTAAVTAQAVAQRHTKRLLGKARGPAIRHIHPSPSAERSGLPFPIKEKN